ncbi:JmjC domain-containing histone demethylation protein 1 [Teratosphaeriaceae sp. CCFEE 6253]|nr:JmjC domain-containing histone demethylation protein 1 [Teratosphaeriaceae sp. CCFEE 6253]
MIPFNGSVFSTPKTSVLGPKRVACDTCRKRRIRCKHKEIVVQVTPEVAPSHAQLAPELHDNIMVTPARPPYPRVDDQRDSQIHEYHADGTPVEHARSSSGAVPMTLNGVSIFGEPPKRGRSKACFECRRSKRRCVHDDSGNVDPVKAAETPVPRGSNTKPRLSSEDGSPQAVKMPNADGAPHQGGTAGILMPQKHRANPSPSYQSHPSEPPRIVHHPPEDDQQPEIDPSLFSYPEPGDNDAYTNHNYPYPEAEQSHPYASGFPSLEQIASEVLDMNGRADEGDFIDRQLNALAYERLNGPQKASPYYGNGGRPGSSGAKATHSVDSAVSFPDAGMLHQDGADHDLERSVDDRLREALALDEMPMYGLPPVSASVETNGYANGVIHAEPAPPEHVNEDPSTAARSEPNALPLYQPPAPLSVSPEQTKRLPVTNGHATANSSQKRKRETVTAGPDPKKARVPVLPPVQAVRESSPEETEDERMARLLQTEELGLRKRTGS